MGLLGQQRLLRTCALKILMLRSVADSTQLVRAFTHATACLLLCSGRANAGPLVLRILTGSFGLHYRYPAVPCP